MSKGSREKQLAKQHPAQIRQVNNFISRNRKVPVKLEKIAGKFFFDKLQGRVDVEKVSDLSYQGWINEYDRLVERSLKHYRDLDSLKASIKSSAQSYGESIEPIIKMVSADCKDLDGLIEGLRSALAELGIAMIDHPDFDGSDTYGFLLSNRPLGPEEIKEYKLFPDGDPDEEADNG